MMERPPQERIWELEEKVKILEQVIREYGEASARTDDKDDSSEKRYQFHLATRRLRDMADSLSRREG